MTTEELENKLKISKNTWIHCPTLELAKQVLNIFHQLGLKWCRENTIYYPFAGEYSSLEFTHAIGYKIINAEEFIALHTEGKIKVCSKCKECRKQEYQELKNNEKEEDSQDFRINDKVYDILLKEVGIVQGIKYSSSIPYGLSVEFKSGLKSYTINGCYIPECKNPQLLHYRDDYNYDVINFNNLPKRQEPKRWRAEKEGVYSFLEFDNEYWFLSNDTKDDYVFFDNNNYNSGNYFQTKEEAQEVADKLNKCFQELINPNK